MPSPAIFTEAGNEAASVFSPETGFHSNVVVTGEHAQLIWAKLKPNGTYALHTHEHEQVSMLIHGRMRLTVGDEVLEIGPGDGWYAPANVPHGGEVIGDEPVVFVDIYAPPSASIVEHVEQMRVNSQR